MVARTTPYSKKTTGTLNQHSSGSNKREEEVRQNTLREAEAAQAERTRLTNLALMDQEIAARKQREQEERDEMMKNHPNYISPTPTMTND